MSENNEVNTGLKTLAKTSVIVLIGIFLSKLFTYLYRIVIARYYGPEVYGIFSLALIVLGFFIAFSSLGLTEGLARFSSFYRGKKQFDRIRYLFKKMTIILGISSLFSGVVLFLSAEFISINLFHTESMIIFLRIFSILIPLTIITNVFLNLIKSFEKVGWYSSIWNILQNVVKFAALLIFIFLGVKEKAIIFSYTLGIFSMLLAAYFVCKYKIKEIFGLYHLKKPEKKEIIHEVFSYSWPVLFSGLINSLFYWTDSSIIGYLMQPSDVGLYNAATPLVGLMAIIPVMFSQLFFPLITKYFSQEKYYVINELSKQVGKWVFILTLPVFMIIFLFPGTIINLFFGSEYLPAVNVLRILSVGGMFSSFTFLLIDLISMAGKSKLIFFNMLFCSILNLVLDIFLVKRFGIEGAAIATTIVWILLTIILVVEVKSYVHILPFRKKMIRIFLISLIPASLILLIKNFLDLDLIGAILFGSFFILSYVLLVFLTGCLDKTDIAIFKDIIGKLKK